MVEWCNQSGAVRVALWRPGGRKCGACRGLGENGELIMSRKLALVLIMAVGLVCSAGVSMNVAKGEDAPTTQPKHERHPEIRQAIRHLEEAKKNLEKGAHDFQGHRVAALKATETALEECRAALKADAN